MADNTQLSPGVGGDILATEDIAGVKLPVSKIRIGDKDVDGGDVTPNNPFPTADDASRRQLEDVNVSLLTLFEALQQGLLKIQTTIANPDLAGAIPTAPPGLAGGIDTTGRIRSLLTDILGRQYMLTQGQAAVAAAIATAQNPVYQGLSDGTVIRAVLGDTSGRQMVVGAGAAGSAVAGNPNLVAGTDGANARILKLDATGELFLVCDAAPGAAIPAAVSVNAGADQLGKVRTIQADLFGVQQVEDKLLTRSLDNISIQLDQLIRCMQQAFNVEGQ